MLTILKIGGSVITDKTRAETPRLGEMERIAREIKISGGNLVLVHGAGSFGHPQVKDNGSLLGTVKGNKQVDKAEVVLRQAGFVNCVHSSVVRLNSLFVDALHRAGVPALGFHPFELALLSGGRISFLDARVICFALARGFVPVVHGDVALDTTGGVSVLSGDQLTPFLARKMRADLVGVGSNVDGVLDLEGNVVTEINQSNFDEVKSWLGGGSGVDVTGGMAGKVGELLSGGFRVRVFNASQSGMVSRFLQGEEVGTLITN